MGARGLYGKRRGIVCRRGGVEVVLGGREVDGMEVDGMEAKCGMKSTKRKRSSDVSTEGVSFVGFLKRGF